MAILGGLFLFVVVPALLFGPAILIAARVGRLNRRIEDLEREVARLQRPGAQEAAPEFHAPPARVTSAEPPPTIAANAAPVAMPAPAVPPPTADVPALAAPSVAAASPLAAPAPHPARAPMDFGRIEQQIGGVWLQNLGAVLLLLGLFLMIVWGYSQGRLGPQVLVGAGVLLGIAFVWRGDRVARHMPPFGHALIGTGLGIIYLTLDLGFVRLQVLSAPVALALLALVSLAAVAAGLRYRVQLIGVLGVIGAFLPQFFEHWLGLGSFQLSPWLLLAYLATVNVLVFALAARAGWSALDLLALLLSAASWVAAFPGIHWDWGQQIALAALFAALGLAPLPRLAAVEGRVRAIDLAVVAAAPLAMLFASAPFLAWAEPRKVAMLLFALALVWVAAAIWIDRRRPERDLWMPLTGAATLFVTAALERALGPDYTPLAWCAEGVVLLALGLAPRGGWLRVWGSLVLLVGACWPLGTVIGAGESWGPPPILHPGGLRALGEVAAVLVAAAVLRRGRARLTPGERQMPELWSGLGHLLLVVWIGVEGNYVASAFVEPQPGLHRMPPPIGIPLDSRREALAMALRGAAWLAQAGALITLGIRGSNAVTRGYGYLVGLIAMVGLWLGMAFDGWGLDQVPVLNATALLGLAAVAGTFLIAARLAAGRERLGPSDRRAAEAWAAAAAVTLLLWSARESGHVASAVLGVAPGGPALAADTVRRLTALAAAGTSGAWLVEAVALLLAGWIRRSAFLRWCALALIGITLLKFIAVDLQTVEVFWRFLTAIVAGAALLAMSYAYQRRVRGRPDAA